MLKLDDNQQADYLFTKVRYKLYDMVEASPAAAVMGPGIKHELIQWAFLQWTAANDNWPLNPTANWASLPNPPFSDDLPAAALVEGLASWQALYNTLLDDQDIAQATTHDIIPFCQKVLGERYQARRAELLNLEATKTLLDSLNIQ